MAPSRQKLVEAYAAVKAVADDSQDALRDDARAVLDGMESQDADVDRILAVLNGNDPDRVRLRALRALEGILGRV